MMHSQEAAAACRKSWLQHRVRRTRAIVFLGLLLICNVPVVAQSSTTNECVALLERITQDPSDLTSDGRYRPRLWDKPPPDARIFATERVAATGLTIMALPTDALTFAKIYDRPPSASELRELSAHRGDAIPDAVPSTAATLATTLANSNAKFVTFIGHNDRGQFRFPDGSSLRLYDIIRICIQHGKRAVFLSCEADQYVSGRAVGAVGELSFGEAAQLCNRLKAFLKDKATTSLDDVHVFMRSEEARVGFSYNVKYMLTRATATAAVSSIVALLVYVIDKVADASPEDPDLVAGGLHVGVNVGSDAVSLENPFLRSSAQ